MSLTRIVKETMKKPNLPLSLDSGAATNIYFEHGGPIDRRSQNGEIWITKFNNKLDRLMLIETLQQQVHPA